MKRPKFVEKQLVELNDYFRAMKVQDYQNNMLFHWWCNYLLKHNWYCGFNFHIDRYYEINGESKLVRALTGPTDKLIGEDRNNWYLQIW